MIVYCYHNNRKKAIPTPTGLRAQMKKAVARELTQTTALYLPPAKLTTDNAAMIVAAGYLHAIKKEFEKAENLKAIGNLSL